MSEFNYAPLPTITVSQEALAASAAKPVRRLTCCCCGESTRGRQWWNRDSGYGLCNACISYCKADIPMGETHEYYGVRGVHYDVQAEA